jgi:hypothetical protein
MSKKDSCVQYDPRTRRTTTYDGSTYNPYTRQVEAMHKTYTERGRTVTEENPGGPGYKGFNPHNPQDR